MNYRLYNARELMVDFEPSRRIMSRIFLLVAYLLSRIRKDMIQRLKNNENTYAMRACACDS